jgi:peptidoglycan/xylan/chitin deacetylase (PgdA/CDA1 family)
MLIFSVAFIGCTLRNSDESKQASTSNEALLGTAKEPTETPEQKAEREHKEKVEKREAAINSYGFNSKEIEDIIKAGKTKVDGRKVAFLTFDDGPSTTNTEKILDILNHYEVKATFFIMGKQLDKSDETRNLLKEIYDAGHAIGNHTYSHDYTYLYPNRSANAQNIMSDIDKTQNIMKEILGQDFECKIVRFPGGHMSWKNMASIDEAFAQRNLNYVDWNALNGDAESKKRNKDELVNRFKETFLNQDRAVVLMHDTYGKESTVEALPSIIEILKEKGYEFGVLN